MRLFLCIPLTAATMATLGACGQSDEAFRASYRTKSVEACVTGTRASPNAALVDGQRLCTCMVDRYMRDTPSDRLKAERDQTEPPPAARAAMIQCATEAIRAQSGQPAAPAPAR